MTGVLAPILAIVVLSITALGLTGCVDPRVLPGIKQLSERQTKSSTVKAEEDIKKSPLLQELSSICTEQIPLPSDFRLIAKRVYTNINPTVGYAYYSEAEYTKVKEYYVDQLTREGWQLTYQKDGGWGPRHIKLKRGQYVFNIEYGRDGLNGKANYFFNCGKLPD